MLSPYLSLFVELDLPGCWCCIRKYLHYPCSHRTWESFRNGVWELFFVGAITNTGQRPGLLFGYYELFFFLLECVSDVAVSVIICAKNEALKCKNYISVHSTCKRSCPFLWAGVQLRGNFPKFLVVVFYGAILFGFCRDRSLSITGHGPWAERSNARPTVVRVDKRQKLPRLAPWLPFLDENQGQRSTPNNSLCVPVQNLQWPRKQKRLAFWRRKSHLKAPQG